MSKAKMTYQTYRVLTTFNSLIFAT